MPYKGLYIPTKKEPYFLSRSKIEEFINCPRCFYLDRRFGIGQPGGLPFTLNSAVDYLLKKEFDIHRAKGIAHPLMKQYKIKAVPLAHELIDDWRNNFKGIQYLHQPTNFLIYGAIDDLWLNNKKELYIVDYKSTSINEEVDLEDEWKMGYKRQMEIYQWLFRKNGFKVSNTGYFVYANGKKDKKAFDGKLEFEITILPYCGNDKWVDKTIKDAYKCLQSPKLPAPNPDCEFCKYRKEAKKIEK
jgi:CRISPR/Cas system-associated exonuclease Cas4 (RecB family)